MLRTLVNKSNFCGLLRGNKCFVIHRINHLISMSSSSMFNLYVTRNIPQSAVTLLEKHCSVVQWKSDNPVPRAELLKHIKGVDGLFCLLTDKVDAEIIKAAGPKLKVISTMSVGFDHIDLKAAKEAGIAVGYTPDVLTDATAELTVSLLLTVSRRIIEASEAVKGGTWSTWSPLWMCGKSLSHSTVGIVGLGRIGTAVAKRLKPFGVCKLLYCGSDMKTTTNEFGAVKVSFDTLLRDSDFVIVTCALTKENEGMFNAEAFNKMKDSGILINTSRGGLVNQRDLYEALKQKKIAAAGLDVTTPEPLPTTDPLLTLPNCVVLPHIGSATVETRTTMAEICAQNIIAALSNEKMPAQVVF